jgi:hypothetical protein
MSVIVGGGIAGLSKAYVNTKMGISSVVLEKTHDFGGRLKTVVIDGVSLETGASITHTNSPFFTLVTRDLGFPTVCLGKPNVSHWPVHISLPHKTESVHDWIHRISTPQEAAAFIESTPAWFEAAPQNARTFLKGLQTEGEYHRLGDGFTMSHVIDRLIHVLRSTGMVRLMPNHHVTAIRGLNVVCQGGVVLTGSHIHLAISSTAASQIDGLPSSFTCLIDVLTPLSSLRFYVVVPSANDLDRLMMGHTSVVGGGEYHWALRTGERQLMVSYTDGERADHIHRRLMSSPHPEDLAYEYMSDIARVTGGVVPQLVIAVEFYWKEAITVVQHFVTRSVYENIRRQALPLLSSMSESISPDDHGLRQAWIDAHLSSFTT